MSIWQTIILGIIEGITEFLPISSTAHLILAGELLKINNNDFQKTFEIVIQLGAILAVVILYFHTLFKWLTIKKLFVAFVPTAIIGFALYPIIKKVFFAENLIILWSLIIGGIILIVFELIYRRRDNSQASDNLDNISYGQCLIIGLFQALAVVPGVSRAAATIIGGLSLGISRRTIVEFSFLLAVPTMLAASSLDLYKNYSSFSHDQLGLLAIGFTVAFFVALGVIKLLISYIRRFDFIPFGVYRIIIGVLFLLFLL